MNKVQTLKVSAILDAERGLTVFGRTDKPGNVALIAMLIVEAVERISDRAHQSRSLLFEKYGSTQDKKQIAPEHEAAYIAEANAIAAQEVQISTPMLKRADIEKINVAPNVLKLIKPFIDFSE